MHLTKSKPPKTSTEVNEDTLCHFKVLLKCSFRQLLSIKRKSSNWGALKNYGVYTSVPITVLHYAVVQHSAAEQLCNWRKMITSIQKQRRADPSSHCQPPLPYSNLNSLPLLSFPSSFKSGWIKNINFPLIWYVQIQYHSCPSAHF